MVYQKVGACFKTRVYEYRLIYVQDVQVEVVEVVEHTSSQSPSSMSKEELKAFMVGLLTSLLMVVAG